MKTTGKEKEQKKGVLRSAKESAYVAVFAALLIAVQLALSAVPGVELVTVLFVAFAFVFGISMGMIAATAFSLLRQMIFGFFPNVLLLYLLYYNLLTLLFGFLGKRFTEPKKKLVFIVLIACACTACFTLLDNIITPLWYAYTRAAARIYFKASLAVLLPQLLCTAVSVSVLFLPLYAVFRRIK